MSDPEILALIESLRADQVERDRKVDAQLNKIHDLVNSQLTDAVNRFREALKTIERLKAELEAKSPHAEPAPTGVPAVSGMPPSDEQQRAQLVAFIEATKTMALAVIEQGERMAHLLMEKRTLADNERRAERRRLYP